MKKKRKLLTIKTVKLQAVSINNQSYKVIIEQYDINSKSNNNFFKCYESALNKNKFNSAIKVNALILKLTENKQNY